MKTVIPDQLHKITNDRLPPSVLETIKKLQDNGFVAYLYGGAVRDLLLGQEVNDYDLATNASKKECEEILGESFTYNASINQLKNANNVVIEIIQISPTKKNYCGTKSVNKTTVDFSPCEYSEAFDFTINALIYDSSSQCVLDYHGGLFDLCDNKLKTLTSSRLVMNTDKNIFIHALRLLARMGCTLDAELKVEMENASYYIKRTAPEYMFAQLYRFFTRGYAKKSLNILTDYGILDIAFPSIAKSKDRKAYYSYLETLTEKFDAFDFDDINLLLQPIAVYAYILAQRVRELSSDMEFDKAVVQVLSELGEYFPIEKLATIDPKAYFCRLLIKISSSDTLELSKEYLMLV